MRISMPIVLAGISVFSMVGTAVAAEPFSTLGGVNAAKMKAAEMERVRGRVNPNLLTGGPRDTHMKPPATWLLAVLDGNANAKNTAAISKNH